MSYQIQGKLQALSQPEQKTDTFSVQTGILEVEENINGTVYKNYIGFQMTNKSIGILDSIAPGSIVNLHFDLRGNMWRDKAITNVNVYKADVVAPAAGPQPQCPQPQPQPQGNPWAQPQQAQPQPNPWGQPQPQQPQQPQPQGSPWAQPQQPQQPQPQPNPWAQPQPQHPKGTPWGQPQQGGGDKLPF